MPSKPRLKPVILLTVIAVIAGCGGHDSIAAAPRPPQKLYLSNTSSSHMAAERWRAQGLKAEAGVIDQPVASWFVGVKWSDASDVQPYVAKAAKANRLPTLVAYNLPGRDCGSYSSGGAQSEAAYLNWMTAFAKGIGRRRAEVILEPDALASITNEGCVSAENRAMRLRVMRRSITLLKAYAPKANVYLDAGNVAWVNPTQMASILNQAGVKRAAGFAVNVSNFYSTKQSLDYGLAVSRGVGNKSFVIDTSRNGNGAPPAEAESWCNPPGRALGLSPREVRSKRVAVHLRWVKTPGESDGQCKGGPPAGTWWEQYALELSRNRLRGY